MPLCSLDLKVISTTVFRACSCGGGVHRACKVPKTIGKNLLRIFFKNSCHYNSAALSRSAEAESCEGL